MTLLELAILGLLEEQELHGYELKKRLGDTLGLLVSVSFGSLYPALSRLEAAGAVAAVAPAAEAEPSEATARIPMTGSLGGERAAFRGARLAGRGTGSSGGLRSRRQRKVYAITQAGRSLFRELLGGGEVSADDDRSFALRLAFARHLPPDARLRLLERRRAVLTQRRARSAGPARDTWTAALAERRAETLAADIDWLDRLIAAEQARASTGPAPSAAPTSLARAEGPHRKADTA